MILLPVVTLMALVVVGAANPGLDASHEPPFNCQASLAAVKPSAARQACKELVESAKGDENQEEDLVFECACGLVTHTIWYKSILSFPMKQLIQAMDKTIVVNKNAFSGDRPDAQRGMLLGSLYDRVGYLATEADKLRRDINRNFMREFRDISFDLHTGDITQVSAKTLAQDTCQQLAKDTRLTGFIRPSLDAIAKSKMGGENTRRAVILSQPELSNLLALLKLCQSLDWSD